MAIQEVGYKLSFFNSVVLVTILSVVLILIGLGCFVVSLTLYVLSKVRSKKRDQEKTETKQQLKSVFNTSQLIETDVVSNNSESGIASGSQTRSSSSSSSSLMQQSMDDSMSGRRDEKEGIMVYDVMPSQQISVENECGTMTRKGKPNLMDRIYRKTNEMFMVKEKMAEQQIYTIATSESGSYGEKRGGQSLASSNVSPVTTTTITSGIDSLIKQQQKGKKRKIIGKI